MRPFFTQSGDEHNTRTHTHTHTQFLSLSPGNIPHEGVIKTRPARHQRQKTGEKEEEEKKKVKEMEDKFFFLTLLLP